jgi:hypothetical protein
MNIGNITTNRYTYGNYELANKKNLPVSEQNSKIKDDVLKRGQELANKYYNIPYADKALPTESQLEILKDKYGNTPLTKEKYQSFLQDLTDMGVLSEVESQLAGKETMVRLCIPVSTSTVGMVSPYDDDIWQLDNNVNITDYIKYRASCDTFYYINGVSHESSVDELYGYISNIISEIKK